VVSIPPNMAVARFVGQIKGVAKAPYVTDAEAWRKDLMQRDTTAAE
jgi:hypothetical protein